jgi:DNA primase catalytic core
MRRITDEIKQSILNLDIVSIISMYISLKQKGAVHEACCPFHDEKTPSFKVFPKTNTYKCFGCGAGGNGITFVMEHKNMSYPEACQTIANEFGIEIPDEEYTEEEEKIFQKRNQLYAACNWAKSFFAKNLQGNKIALKYAKSRWTDETIAKWDIGFAEDSWTSLKEAAAKEGFSEKICLEAGLLNESKGKIFDRFMNRLIVPIHDKTGRCCGFTARTLVDKKDIAKYINSPESAIFSKGGLLFGMEKAYKAIRESRLCYIVEGNPDVMRMHEMGAKNTVGTQGTAFTYQQFNVIKDIADSFNIIGDNDDAGNKALHKIAKFIVEQGKAANIIVLPKENENDKVDPDSFFSQFLKESNPESTFKQFIRENIKDYISYVAEKNVKKTNPDFKSNAIDELAKMVSFCESETRRELYIESIGNLYKCKAFFKKKVNGFVAAQDAKEIGEKGVPADSGKFAEKWGFYEEKNVYKFMTKDGIMKGSNFVMKPLFHIKSVSNAKRLYEVTNEDGHKEVIEFKAKELISLAAFNERIESIGNFIWYAGEGHLKKLKGFLYKETQTAIEITQLGWQKKHKVWAWSNGLINGLDFVRVDKFGIATTKNENYYIPALSSIYQSDEQLFTAERNFVHQEKQNITFREYADKFIHVYTRERAVPGLLFYIATLFRDIITGYLTNFPILNLFGLKGAGKSDMAFSLMAFFYKEKSVVNIQNVTKAALADHVSAVANALVHVDEYKNGIDYEKVEFLKGLYDGMGRTRMNMDKDKKKETSNVDCGVILSGQEMPTLDIALFSRLIHISFSKTTFSAEEAENQKELDGIRRRGLTHITNQILGLRPLFKEHFFDTYNLVYVELEQSIQAHIIETRMLKSWSIILAAFKTLENQLNLPFTYEEAKKICVKALIYQNAQTNKNNEVNEFWAAIEYLVSDNKIREEEDYRIDFVSCPKTDKIPDAEWSEPKKVLYIKHSRIFTLYQKYSKEILNKQIKSDTIDFYLKNDKRFLGKKASTSFIKLDRFGNVEMKKVGEGIDEENKPKRSNYNAYAFDYDALNINIEYQTEEEKVDAPF